MIKSNIIYEIFDYDKSLLYFSQTKNIEDLSTITVKTNTVKIDTIAEFKVKAIDRVTNAEMIFPKPFSLKITKNLAPSIEDFIFNGVTTGIANTKTEIYMFGCIDSNTKSEDLVYSIKNIVGKNVAFNKVNNIKEFEKIEMTFLDVSVDTSGSFDIFVNDGKPEGEVFCQRISSKTIATKLIPNDFIIIPSQHVDAIEGKEYIGNAYITGITTPVNWSVENGLGSTDGGKTFTNYGLVKNDSYIIIKGIANNFINTVSLTVSGKTNSMDIIAIPERVDNFILTPEKHNDANFDDFYYSSGLVTGIVKPTSWTVDNGEGSVDGGLTFSNSGIIYPNQTIIVRGKALYSGSSIVTVTVDNYKTGTMVINTLDDVIPACFDIIPNEHLEVEIDKEYFGTALVTGINSPTTWSVSNGVGSTDGGTTFSNSGIVYNNETILLKAKPKINEAVTVILNVNGKLSYMYIKEVYEDIRDMNPDCFSIIPPVHDNTIVGESYAGVATITGINTKVKWSVTNGEGSTDGIIFSTIGYVENEQRIFVRSNGEKDLKNVSLHVGNQCGYMLLIPEEMPEDIINPCCVSINPPVHVDTLENTEYQGTVTISGITGDANYAVIDGYLSLDNGVTWYQSGTLQPSNTILIKGVGDKLSVKSIGLTVNQKTSFMTLIPKPIPVPPPEPESINEVNQDVSKECCNCGTPTSTPTPTPTPTPEPNPTPTPTPTPTPEPNTNSYCFCSQCVNAIIPNYHKSSSTDMLSYIEINSDSTLCYNTSVTIKKVEEKAVYIPMTVYESSISSKVIESNPAFYIKPSLSALDARRNALSFMTVQFSGYCKDHLDRIVSTGIFNSSWTTKENNDAVDYVKKLLSDKKYTYNDLLQNFYDNPNYDIDGVGIGGVEINLKDITYQSMNKVTWKVDRADYPDFKWQNRPLTGGNSARGLVIYKVTYSDDLVCYIRGSYVYHNSRT